MITKEIKNNNNSLATTFVVVEGYHGKFYFCGRKKVKTKTKNLFAMTSVVTYGCRGKIDFGEKRKVKAKTFFLAHSEPSSTTRVVIEGFLCYLPFFLAVFV